MEDVPLEALTALQTEQVGMGLKVGGVRELSDQEKSGSGGGDGRADSLHVCVCVYHLYRCKTSTLQGRVALMSYHTQRSCGHEWGETWPVSCTCYTILYIYSPAPGRI